MHTGRVESPSIDAILAGLMSRCRSAANDLLDIKLHTARGECAGTCVGCFYRVQRRLGDTQELCSLRKWMEEMIEVVAYGKDGQPIRRMPLNMDHSDLESCCRSYIKAASGLIPTGKLELQFAYTGRAAA